MQTTKLLNTKINPPIPPMESTSNEKIDDSRGDDNKQKKYELMRIRNQLQRTSDKIRHNLKY